MWMKAQKTGELQAMEDAVRRRPNGTRVLRLLRELSYLDARLAVSLRHAGAYPLVMALLAALLLLAVPAAQAVSPSSYEQGLEAVTNYRYSEALMHFQAAAEQGNRDAERNLGLMLLFGDRLYGGDVVRNQGQARRWLQAAARDGCEVSSFMLRVMSQVGR